MVNLPNKNEEKNNKDRPPLFPKIAFGELVVEKWSYDPDLKARQKEFLGLYLDWINKLNIIYF